MRRSVFVASCFLFASVSGSQSDAPDVCHLFAGEVATVTHTLNMKSEGTSIEMTVPTVYFEDPWDRVNGAELDAQLFSVTLDDFTPVYREHTSSLLKERNLDFFNFVLHDINPMAEGLDVKLWLSTPDRAENPDIKENPRSYFDFQEDPSGLLRAVPRQDLEMRRDLFAKFSTDGMPTAVITCRLGGVIPNCNHDFRSHGVDVRANYPRVHLADWLSIQTKVEQFLECAVEGI